VDISTVGGALGALKSAKDIAVAMLELRDQQAIQAKVIALQGAIMDAQERVFAANEERLSLLERIKALEGAIAAQQQWGAEKDRYELRAISKGAAVVYALRPAFAVSEPAHWLCPNCFTKDRKSFLLQGQIKGYSRPWACATCESVVTIRWDQSPAEPDSER
jgi:hypothetical protein